MKTNSLPDGGCAVLFALLLLTSLPMALQAQFTYVTNQGAITITGYTGPGGALMIPSTIDGLPVTDIGDFAFAWKQTLTSLTFPDSVTNIATAGVCNCNFLTEVRLANGLRSIGSDAFDTCVNLPSIIIPDSVTHIEHSAFFCCRSLTNVRIGNSVSRIDYGAFAACNSLSAIAVDPNNPAFGHASLVIHGNRMIGPVPGSGTTLGLNGARTR